VKPPDHVAAVASVSASLHDYVDASLFRLAPGDFKLTVQPSSEFTQVVWLYTRFSFPAQCLWHSRPDVCVCVCFAPPVLRGDLWG